MSERLIHALQRSLKEAKKNPDLARAFSVLLRDPVIYDALSVQKPPPPVNRQSINSDCFSFLLDRIPEGVLLFDLSGYFVLCNRAAQKMLHLPEKDYLGKKFWDVLPDDALGFPMKEALGFGTSYKQIYRNQMKIQSTFFYDGPKSAHRMLVLLSGLKEKERFQNLLIQNAKMKELGEMAAQIVHEVRNPLGGIRGFASLLKKDLEQKPYFQEMADAIIEGCKGIEKLTSSLLQFSKPTPLEIKTQDLGLFLKKALRFVKVDPSYPSHVTLFSHIPDAPLLVPFDPEKLHSALLNLLFNAFQAIENKGAVTVSLMQIGLFAQISIADTGSGIEKEHLDFLFSPFYTTKKGGNGIGLVEVKKIVEAHLGKISLRSEKGVGTTFTIQLPLQR